MMKLLRAGFTLIEVNLAILIMGSGILSVAALFLLGYRENSQSQEDVATSAYTERVLGPLVMALSDTNITWKVFDSLGTIPEGGWEAYFDKERPGEICDSPQGLAAEAYIKTMGKLTASGVSAAMPPMPAALGACGLVVSHTPGSPIVRIAFRASKLPRAMLAAPLYYTAVAFQGQQATEEEDGP